MEYCSSHSSLEIEILKCLFDFKNSSKPLKMKVYKSIAEKHFDFLFKHKDQLHMDAAAGLEVVIEKIVKTGGGISTDFALLELLNSQNKSLRIRAIQTLFQEWSEHILPHCNTILRNLSNRSLTCHLEVVYQIWRNVLTKFDPFCDDPLKNYFIKDVGVLDKMKELIIAYHSEKCPVNDQSTHEDVCKHFISLISGSRLKKNLIEMFEDVLDYELA